jgi:uncharacterized protein (DUF1778 family)
VAKKKTGKGPGKGAGKPGKPKAPVRASGAGRRGPASEGARRGAGAPAAKIDRPVALRLTAPEFQLVSYAASKTRARGVNAFMREAVVEAARHAAGKEMSEDILSGRGTVRLLKESLAASRTPRVPHIAR